MELRVLEYFIAVAREQNISRAAEYLHLTQPTLSRQLKDLENEFGKQLLVRGKRKVTLTDDGAVFRKMAEEIVSLANRAKNEMTNTSATVAGDIYIGSGESFSIRHIMKAAHTVQTEYPDVHFHFTSGDGEDLAERLDKGLFDFCILYGEVDKSKYEYLELPFAETWGLLMPDDVPLAKKEFVNTEDLWDLPLIFSRQTITSTRFLQWIGKSEKELNIVNTYNLVYNAALMAETKMGYVITLDHLVNTNGTNLCFKRIMPLRELQLFLVWKKYRKQSKAAEIFKNELQTK